MELLEKLERERREIVQRRKDEKQRMKDLETPEQKRARRLAKKIAKEKKDKEKMGWDSSLQHYTMKTTPLAIQN